MARKKGEDNESFPLPEKMPGAVEKRLANVRSRKKITKKAHAPRGQETKWGILNENVYSIKCQ
jgi:hypothetical protein